MTETGTRTATFLFTDVEGSTQLLKAMRERYGEMLAEHQRLLREAVARHGGEEVDTQGDACFFAFGEDGRLARGGGRTAFRRCPRLAGGGRGSRPDGVHTGRAELEDGCYVGVAVHRAARISAAAHGGQILASQTTRELLADEEQEAGDLRLRDLGTHPLKISTGRCAFTRLQPRVCGTGFVPSHRLRGGTAA